MRFPNNAEVKLDEQDYEECYDDVESSHIMPQVTSGSYENSSHNDIKT